MSITQESNEVMKETFKRFGLLAVPTLIIGLIKITWEGSMFSNIYYLVPVVYAGLRIWETERGMNKIKSIRKE